MEEEKIPLLQRLNGKLPRRFRKRDVEADLKDPSKFRTVVPLHARNAHPDGDTTAFANNTVTTSKYTIVSFIPKNLYEQFHRIANLYFLLIAGLQLIPGLSPTGRFTTLVPLVIVMSITALKEIIEDIQRHRQDNQVNNKKVIVVREGRHVTIKWKDVVVGDLVKVMGGEYIPADLVLLSSSEEQGICYIETANLDGETNLKIRQALPETATLNSAEALGSFSGIIKCEPPNRHLYNFTGSLYWGDRVLALSVKQILLRGSMLRNTKWAYGMAIFTGQESKLMQNATKSPAKRSNVEKTTNWMILAVFLFELTLCAGCALGSFFFQEALQDAWYLGIRGSPAIDGLLAFLTFLILFNNLIPISLYVTMEAVKFGQAFFINNDILMYYDKKDTPAEARTSNLNEELGQVEYIFSDKTGTLTCNRMRYVKCSIGGIAYGEMESKKDADAGVMGESSDDVFRMGSVQGGDASSDSDEDFGFSDDRLLRHLADKHENADVINEFLTCLSVCHTVIPETKTAGSDDENEFDIEEGKGKEREKEGSDEELLPSIGESVKESTIIYQAASPDEGALVTASRRLGYFFHYRTPTSVFVKVAGEDREYQILNVIEFTSTRKRMSVICRTPEGKVVLYCKGADNVIFERLAEEQPYKVATLRHLQEFASLGLRTLCIACAVLDEKEYDQWNIKWLEASTALGDREEQVAEVAELIERDLFLLGATAIEDKLQDGVPQTIALLQRANIKIWVLTGDKQETAINVGYACNLLSNSMEVLIINEEDQRSTEAKIEEYLEQYSRPPRRGTGGSNLALVIDGHTLVYAMEEHCRLRLLELAKKCVSIIACRVSPIQKAEIVRLVKDNMNAITLAIGDGANDTSMIQAADVGVGISGEEGLQAARASDYSIAQFRFLGRLLLVHGRNSYGRISKVILYSFYKNIVLYLAQFWYNIYNGFSGQSLFERWTLALYNVLFTLLPIIILGLYNKEVDDGLVYDYPMLYTAGQTKSKFNIKIFLGWLINSIFHASVMVLAVLYVYENSILDASGQNLGVWDIGVVIYSCIVLTVTIKLCLETNTWTILHHLAVWGSLVVYAVFILVWDMVPAIPIFTLGSEVFYTIYRLAQAPSFYACLFLVPTIALLRDFSWKFLFRSYLPQSYHIVQEVRKTETAETQKEALPRKTSQLHTGYSFSQGKGAFTAISKGTHGKKEV